MSGATLGEIDDLARAYAAARGRLEDVTDEVRDVQRREVRRRLRAIKFRVAEVSAAREALAAAIGESPELFEKPRTRAVEGVKYGLRKKPGRLALEHSEEIVIRRLRRRLGTGAEAHVRTRESLVRDGLRELDARTLAHVGISMVDASDEIVISAASGDLDKLVEALLDGVDEEEAAA